MDQTKTSKIGQEKHQAADGVTLVTKRKIGALLKRAFDIILSALGLVVLSPFFGIIALAIKHDSPGPVYYRAARVGRHGKIFNMLKFRTMYDKYAHVVSPPLTSNGDPRVTPIGHWLRATKLNELPQLWNVLMGEMSLVGPRPEDPEFVEKWPDDLRNKILSIRPGITSPASILYRDEEKQLEGINFLDDYLKDIMPDKMRLDLLYVEAHNLVTDLDVIFLTLLAILPKLESKKFKEKTIFSGPIYRFYANHLVWFLVDFMVAFVAASLAGVFWRLTEPINLGILRVFLLSFSMALFLSLFTAVLGLHRVVWRYASPVLVIDIGLSVLLTSLVFVLINRLWLDGFLLRYDFIFNFALLTFIGLVGTRYRERLVTGVANRWVIMRNAKKPLGERVLIVGAGAGGELAVWLLHKSEYGSAFSIVGYVDDDYRKQNALMAGYPVLGTTRNIPWLVNEHQVGLILFSISKIRRSERKRILDSCQETGARVIVIPDLLEILNDSTNGYVAEGSK